MSAVPSLTTLPVQAGGMRLSIGSKIFGLAVLLVLLMIVVGIASIVLVGKVNQELRVQSRILLPLANRLAAVEATVLEQEIYVHGLRLLHGTFEHVDTGEDAATIAKLHDELDTHFQAASDLLSGPETSGLSSDAQVKTTRTATLLGQVEKEYDDYYKQVLALVDLLDQGRSGEVRLLEDVLEREEGEFYAAVDGLRSEMAGFVEASLALSQRHQSVLTGLIVALTAIAVLIGLLVAALITRGLVGPIHLLLSGLRRVEAGNLEAEILVSSRDEVADLARGFNAMLAGLRAKEEITATFGQYVDPRVVRHLIGAAPGAMPEGDRRVMTVFFSDLVGFTGISERLTPTAMVTLLNAYLAEMSTPIRDSGGVIDKYIGDAIMAYWGPAFVEPDAQATLACGAALEQIARLPAFRARVPEITGRRTDPPWIDMRIGIATGPVVVGAIGSSSMRNYTVIGDTVNLAARLEGACRAYRLSMLVDQATRDATAGIAFREIDALRVRGKDEPVRVFEPLARSLPAPVSAELAETFTDGLTAYRELRLEIARSRFQRCLELVPDDGPSHVFLARTQQLGETPPKDWDGVWSMAG